MNYIDLLLLLPIVWFVYQGFRKGFVIELASLLALVLGIYAALYFSGFAAGFLVDNFNLGPKYVPVVSFIITFILVVFLVYAVGKLLEKLINIIALGFVNKVAGAIFGLFKGAVLISVVLMIINHFNEDFISGEKRSNSMLYEPIEGIAPMLWDRFKDWNPDDERIRELQEGMDPYSV